MKQIQGVKLDMQRGIQNIKNASMQYAELRQRLKQMEHQQLLRLFIKNTRLNLCVTNAKDRAEYTSLKSRMTSPELDNKLLISKQSDCLHEHFTFLKELTSNSNLQLKGGDVQGSKKKNNL